MKPIEIIRLVVSKNIHCLIINLRLKRKTIKLSIISILRKPMEGNINLVVEDMAELAKGVNATIMKGKLIESGGFNAMKILILEPSASNQQLLLNDIY